MLILCAFFSAAIGLYMLLKVGINMWIVLPVTIALTVVIMGMMQEPFKISLTLNIEFSRINITGL